jgi:hypothetical protein
MQRGIHTNDFLLLLISSYRRGVILVARLVELVLRDKTFNSQSASCERLPDTCTDVNMPRKEIGQKEPYSIPWFCF